VIVIPTHVLFYFLYLPPCPVICIKNPHPHQHFRAEGGEGEVSYRFNPRCNAKISLLLAVESKIQNPNH